MAANAANTIEIMAAHSDGMDWFLLIKPFLSVESESNKHCEIIELCQNIVKSEEDILKNAKVDAILLNNFVLAAVDYINSNIDQVPLGQIATVSEATSILLQYLVGFLSSYGSVKITDTGSNAVEHCLKAVKSLCLGDSVLNASEFAALVSKIKASLPSKDAELPTGSDKEPSKSEANKGRSDLSAAILEQLIVPIRDTKESNSPVTDQGNTSINPVGNENSDLKSDVTKTILKCNIEIMQSLKAGEVLIDFCLKLPSIKKANSKIEEAISGKIFSVPINHNEAIAVKNSLHSMLADISLISIVLHLPLIEPLSQTKMDKLHRLCIALLYCTVAQSAASAVLGLMTASASGGTSSTTGSSTAASAGSTAASGGTLPSKGSSGGKDGGKIDGKEGSGIEDPDAHAVILIEEVLGLYEYVGKVIKTSTRAGGNVYQNHLLSGAWVLVSGLQSHISSYCTSQPVSSTINTPPRSTGDEAISAPPSPKPTTTRSPSKSRLSEMVTSTTAATAGAVGSGGGSVRSWLIKFQQSFGVLSVALVDKAIVLMSELFEDLQLEIAEGASSISQVEPAQINNILAQSTALQRVARILTAAPLNQLLFYITIVSYRKACSLKRIRLGSDGAPGDTGSQSDSTTYFDDMIMCSDDSSTEEEEEEEEEDSEPILGLWFEETISAPPGESKDSKNSSITENPDVKPAQHERNTSIVPEKGEAHGFIALSTNIFAFMNKYLLGTKSEYVTNYVQTGLGEQQVLILASIIKDLDRETARTEVVTINRCFGAALGQLYCDFSGALARFSHNFITHRSLQHLQASLLSHLGVSPWNKDQPHGWPLQVYPRTLAVLAQTLLQRPSNEKEASVIGIWHRVVNTLIDNVVNVPQQPANEQAVPQEHEDLNVEHAQVLLYLFHSLNLMQKKSVVLLMAGGILRCSEIGRSSEVKELQLLYLSRVLLLFDYIMKHLYDAPQQLLEQIQWNLFYSTNLKTDSDKEHNMLTKLFTPWIEIEKYYRLRNISDDFVSMKPRFYVVTNVEVNNQETPKLDGLACNFILGTPDKLRYPFLLDALIEILNVTKFCAVKQLSFLGLCAVQYCFSICWRLLLLLPPSNTYIERLSSGEQQVPGLLLLHSLVWGARTNHKNFSRWLKDCLVKQGVYTQQTERMLKSASDTINNLRYDVATARSCILALTPDVKNGPMTQDKLPALWHVILLDSVIAKMQLSLIDESDTNTADASGNTVSGSIYVRDLMPNVLKLAKAILHQTRWSLLTNMMVGSSSVANPNQSTADDIEDILAVASTKNSLTSTLTTDLITMLPSTVPYVLQGWNRSMLEECSMTPFLNDIIPSESYILKIVETHISTLTLENTFSINFSLKRLLFCLTKFICQHVTKIENTDTKRIAINYLVQVTLDVRTEYIYETVCKVLDKLIGDSESEKHQIQVYLQVLKSTYRTITNYVKNPNDLINEKILHNVLKFYEKMLDKPTGRQAMEAFFTGDRDLVEILMSVGNSHISSQYSARILHFFNRLFFCAEKWPTDTSLNYLCSSMSKIAKVDAVRLQAWLKYIIIGSSESNVNVPADMDIIQPDSKEPSPKSDNEAPTSNKSETVLQQGTAYESNASISSPAVTTVVCLDDPQQRSLTMENTQLLQSLTNFFVKQNVANPISEEISLTILKAMITLVTQSLNATLEGTTFTDLISVMTTLADAGVGRGHVYLFPAMAEWLDECREYLLEHSVTEPKGEIIDDKCKLRLDASASMVEYLSDVLSGLHSLTSFRALSPPWEGEMPLEQDPDWIEEADNDDDSGEDSDEDSLCNKICTFTVTQKEFMNQHWYNCHTCRMLDGVGVCSICARVCHRGHDLSYAKYGNFFCDCGAKEDGSCLALVRRSPQSNQQQQQPQISSSDLPSTANVTASTNAAEQLHSSLRRNKEQSESQHHQQSDSRTGTLSKNSSRAASCRIKQFEGCRQWILNYLGHSPLPLTLLQLLKTLLPAVEVTCSRNSPVGCHARAMSALHQLHQSNKKYIASDQLMVPTLGSQEGAFENVRMNYTGEQGQTIRQLLSAHIVRRVAMCCTASTHGRRQHLAVAHEKGKITILQLSTLLKQADSSSRKLTLTRLSSAPIPFTVLTLTANHCNEDFLSVCGLKECHVLTFNANGTVIDHLVLHPQLETGNFIIKSIWLPGSQTCLALITADFVKIYDLSKDALSPQYYFLVPSGKIRDCTFMYDDGMYTILLMSSPGHIYTELLNEDSSAKHGSFYVTNTLEVFHLDVTDVNGQVAGGGVSIYYSHTLRLLFYSYAQGKSFISPLMPKSNCLTVVFPITLSTAPPTAKNNGSSKSSASSSSSINPQSLCQWMEVPNHPGLICCSMQSSNNPVIIMLRPDSIAIQEMKIVQSKAKIMDTVAIRHNSPSGASIPGGSNSGEPRTTLILLCEDGSLKIFMANMETTGFWLSPNMQPSVQSSPIGFMKHGASGGGARKKQCAGRGKGVGPKLQLGGGAVGLPVDFFEHCQPMNDVDIGGNDLLQIYNAAQLKHRLNTKGLYIACTRTLGFTIEITNADSGMVMCGVRVLVGSQEPQRAPSYIEIFGRAINVNVTRSRWYDVPFTREESLQADRKLNVVFGPSQDPDTSVTMVDSIKIFGKTKESFGWPEEIDEPISSTSLAAMSSANVFNDVENVSSAKVISLSKLEKLVTGVLEVLDGTFLLYGNEDKLADHKAECITIATQLLTLPIPPALQIHSTDLLCALHTTKQQYHAYKDQALLQHVLTSLNAMSELNASATDGSGDIDAESYFRLVMIVRGVAATRPQNLIKFSESQTPIQNSNLDDPLNDSARARPPVKNAHLLLQLMDVLWLLHAANPENPALAPVVAPGLKHTEQVIFALVEIIHAFNTCDTYSSISLGVYMQLLLCKDSVIAFSTRYALSRVQRPRCKRRKVFIPSPAQCATPPSKTSVESEEDNKAIASASTHRGRDGAGPSSSRNSDPDQESMRDAVNALVRYRDEQRTARPPTVSNPGAGVGASNATTAASAAIAAVVNPIEALLAGAVGGPGGGGGGGGGGSGFQPLLDIPPDADDETMVEIAIALSLQEQDGDQAAGLGGIHQMLSNPLLNQIAQGHLQGAEAGHFSDTTASAGGSDDEGSTAATDGSTLRTSPAEQGGSVGSESGGSGVESITGDHNVSGRSSAYGDNIQEAISIVSRSENSIATTNYQAGETDVNQPENDDSENANKLHLLRLQLLEKMIEYLPKLRHVSGIRSIPFFQVILQLTSDLDGTSERDKMCLNNLLTALTTELDLLKPDFTAMCIRTEQREVQLVILRLLSVILSRTKSISSPTTSTTLGRQQPGGMDSILFVASVTATHLYRNCFIPYCLGVLRTQLAYWRKTTGDDGTGVVQVAQVVGGNLLKEFQSQTPPDLSPFFLRQFVKGNASDIFATYNQLIMEVALRLPYQVYRQAEPTQQQPQAGPSTSQPTVVHSVSQAFSHDWFGLLCEYMMCSTQGNCVRRQVRKLLLFIAGGKDQYRQTRDIHAIEAHIKAVKLHCTKGGFNPSATCQQYISLPYDTLVEMVEHLKVCLEIALSRVGNWQKFCLEHNDIIPLLFQVSCFLDEGVAPNILQLLNCAVVASNRKQEITKPMIHTDRERSDDSTTEAAFDNAICIKLINCINKNVREENLIRFIKTFILETNTSAVRWQAHSLLLAMYQNSNLDHQEALLNILWKLWPSLPTYGRKASQYIDLLGYFTLQASQKTNSKVEMSAFVDQAVGVLGVQNDLLAHHPNANLYSYLAQYVDIEGYYLEAEPCLVCNNPEIQLATIKLNSVKVDSKYTTTTQIMKLVSSHTISRIIIRIADLKRTKMVRCIQIYYNNRNVLAIVELKNKPALWHKAKKVTIPSGQTEVKIEFPLPIVACNLMVEYSDFYENVQASTETHQCPRCSAAVPANPGVCSNCGENVFQCHKCRAINYDEKDPFLCHSCGFCKYAKFDFTLLAKPCCAVEAIDNDEDRKKMVGNINMSLEKADRIYKQLMANKPCLENLLVRVSECSADRRSDEVVTSQLGNATQAAANVVSSAANSAHQNKINKTIQILAQQYGTECKTSFEELSRIIQKVLISRKELLAYDRRQTGTASVSALSSDQVYDPRLRSRGSQCYGCSSAATDHCLTLLRSMALNPETRQDLCKKGLIQELLKKNLRRGTMQTQDDVRHLICILNRDNSTSTFTTCNLITSMITSRLVNNPSDLRCRPEVALLAALQRLHDSLWTVRLRCLVRLYLRTVRAADCRNPVVTDAVLLPCLKMWYDMCCSSGGRTVTMADEVGNVGEGTSSAAGNKKAAKDKSNSSSATSIPKQGNDPSPVNISKWISKESQYEDWQGKLGTSHKSGNVSKTKEQMRKIYLLEKYGLRWRQQVLPTPPPPFTDEMCEASWVKTLMFNQSSRPTRQVICNILEQCCTGYKRKRKILCILTNYLDEVSVAGEHASEFLSLYQNLISEYGWKQYLTVQGVLYSLADLITSEIEQLHCLEQTSLTSNLTQGYALSRLTDLLASFLVNPAIRRRHKSRLVAAVLNGYLALRRLVVQRTRIIDDTQEKLLELLEVMTTGNEEETKAYMSVCIDAVDNCSPHDYQTPVFIFERLCNIIYPEENDSGEFFLTLEKDAQQEDFLQGRMLGNPYSSSEAGLGPLMRDVKNKICQDCELVALLEDDNGMELLVNNKIMSLDLPVKDVYKKVWLAEGGDADSMRVIYRMRGLLGDATEEFVETLANKAQAAVNNEEVYKMANVLAECEGLQVMLTRLGAIQNLARAKPLLQVLLKLFRLSVKVERVQDVLIQPELAAMTVFLRTLQLSLESTSHSSSATSAASQSTTGNTQSTTADSTQSTEQLLDIMETILSRATSQPLDDFKRFARTCGGPEYVRSLLSFTNHASVRRNTSVLVHLTRVLAGMVYCSEEKTKILLDHFRPVFDFNLFDFEATPSDQQRLEMFCVLTQGIERNVIGNTLKDDIIELGLVREAFEYIGMHAPCVKPTLLRTDSDELKEFITKPALKYILRLLAGLAYAHENTQLAIAAADTIPIIHRLEQVSSDEHVGTLAENLLEALRTNPAVASKIEEVREFTRSEKKRLAMAMREKQLGQLGMRTNDKGQVTAKSIHLQQMEELGEETGLICCICREGYKYQPSKVLAIYTFTKRCNIDDYEAKARKTMGYSTVTHFNIVHVDCHMSAVRLARARDEWESAALQNASTKCNGLLPLWGPQVAESAFASCLARHNAYLQESTSHRDVGHDARSTVHDLKLLLLRFAQERSFHEDTGGGGPQSNLHMVPYLIHMGLYVINTTRVSKKEDSSLTTYLSISDLDRCIESAFEADGPLYWITLSLLLQSNQRWQSSRLAHLRRLLILAHARACTPTGQGLKSFTTNQDHMMLRPYVAYKPYLIYYALIDGIYRHFFKNVTGLDEQWSSNLADYIRHNDEQLLKASERLLETYTEEIVPCSSFTEFCDVAGLLDVIEDPEKYLNDLLHEV